MPRPARLPFLLWTHTLIESNGVVFIGEWQVFLRALLPLKARCYRPVGCPDEKGDTMETKTKHTKFVKVHSYKRKDGARIPAHDRSTPCPSKPGNKR